MARVCGMALAALIVMALAALARGSGEGAASSSRSGAAEGQPVAKVVTLLKDMLKTLGTETDADEEIYNTMACWCETNDKEKAFAIVEAQQKIQDLKDLIAELTVGNSKLQPQIQASGIGLNRFEKSLSEAKTTRAKEKAAFDAEEKDLLKSITSLKAAIVAVEGHRASMLQAAAGRGASSAEGVAAVAQSLRQALTRRGDLKIREQRLRVASLLQSDERDRFLDADTGSYSPSSNRGNMLGAMKEMLATFEKNLAGGREEEANDSNVFEALKASLKQQIVSAGEITEARISDLADSDQKITMSEGDLRDTERKLSADQRFMGTLKKQCVAMEAEFDKRTQTRGEEVLAVNRALGVLDTDEAHDTFAKTFVNEDDTLLQVRKEGGADGRLRAWASQLLQVAARKAHSVQLLAVAAQVRADALAKVKKQLDTMIANLKIEKKDEVKKKDFCTEELFTNEKQRKTKESERAGLDEKIKDLKASVNKMGEEIAALKAGIVEMKLQMKRAGQDREKANREFKVTVADQKATQKLLKYALRILAGFYKKGAALAQTQAGDAAPYQTGRSGVMGLISDILADAKAMQAQAVHDEDNSQKAYEDFVKETNASILADEKAVVNKQKVKAKMETQLAESGTLLDDAKVELEKLGNYNLELHSSCDFVLKNFKVRQEARDEEIEALFEAKSVLSGAGRLEASFLQRRG